MHLFLIKDRNVTIFLRSVVMDGHVIFQEESCLKLKLIFTFVTGMW